MPNKTTDNTKTYDFIHDPGHGWVKVPLFDIPPGFKPTEYSFHDGTFAYLEEDCDATEFWKLCPNIKFRDVYVDDFSQRFNMQRFPGN